MKQSARCTDRPPARRRAFRLLGLALVLLALTLTLPAGVLADPPTPPTISETIATTTKPEINLVLSFMFVAMVLILLANAFS